MKEIQATYDRATHAPQVDYCRELNGLISRSRADDATVVARVEPGLQYAVVRKVDESGTTKMFDGISSPLVFVPNEEKNCGAWTGYVPFALTIRDPKDVVDFLDDQFVLVVVIDLEEIRAIAHSLGHDAEFLDVGEHAVRFVAQSQASALSELSISRHFLGRVGLEFLSLRWLITEALHPVDEKTIAHFESPTPPSPVA